MGILDRIFGAKNPSPPTKVEGGVTPKPQGPEWRYHQAYSEGAAQAKHALSQPPETAIPAPIAPPEGVKDTRPEWVRRQDPILREGYAKEGVSQIPQTPTSGGENKG